MLLLLLSILLRKVLVMAWRRPRHPVDPSRAIRVLPIDDPFKVLLAVLNILQELDDWQLSCFDQIHFISLLNNFLLLISF